MRRADSSLSELVVVQVQPRQQRIVVKHFLKVRHQPFGIRRIAMKPATELIVDAAPGHLRTSVANNLERLLLAGAMKDPQQEFQGHRGRKLGRAAKAAIDTIVVPDHATIGRVQQILRKASDDSAVVFTRLNSVSNETAVRVISSGCSGKLAPC